MILSDISKVDVMRLYAGPGATAGVTTAISLPADLRSEVSRHTPIALCRQTHSLNIALVDNADEYPQDTDALITLRKGLAVGVRTADCVPILLHAPDIGAVAAIHAGWRGSLGQITAGCVKRLIGMGASPALMYAAIGPAICADCYEVDAELGHRFAEAGYAECVHPSPTGLHGKSHIDLKEMNRLQLLREGLDEARISTSEYCTRHSLIRQLPVFPSYRRENGTEERLVTFIAMT
ncbi:MAG: peptidoglycan editing factor PgeF [Bacteroidales bacterium]|nr:peptidoglycan editing factor PgeF [Bacteroidales bacterium]MBD5211500.1 peptidoglycan editing factor PgeF [Bacteroidales bacterium]